MVKKSKVEPRQIPSGRPSLQASLASALAGDDDQRKKISVALKISGGLPSQRYDLDFRATGDGNVSCRMSCELTGRKGKSEEKAVPKGGEVEKLLNQVVDSGLLMAPIELPRFLPDTLVGILTISDGVSEYRVYFAADPEQAKMQEKTLRPELERTVNEIYRLTAKATGLRSVKP